ncbi:uncharacterized protein LOC120015647 isoform X2 [Tripterygium wilfordii]|uniref:uncharacterized protein LOC120015647 isoform X2 n=1 Tax=Tripterygium wilfordii TaxID=458696 RepID=UPI0018F81FEE|nr:uncharacterized protein LOC120015647 isoform X2 [Tripterygium wilfordii]XP_038724087.1 uncharacterized protein LOC120015647 isoform X2 [Tripterygium wilfordii]
MVCSLGSGRMAVMARILTRNISKTISEIGHQKSVAQYICRELCDADEPNLLDEEDMHVFGLRPIADPLYLVCCNTCKKPIKTTQYAAHAEQCWSSKSTEGITLELDGGVACRRPPRKERKKLLAAHPNQSTTGGKQERSRSIDADEATASKSQFESGMTSLFSTNRKGNSSCGVPSSIDGAGVSPENTDHSACVVPPPTKRTRLMTGDHFVLPDDPETASGVTKITSACTLENECRTLVFVDPWCFNRDSPLLTSSGSVMPNDSVVANEDPDNVQKLCLSTKVKSKFPAPLATKTFYSQRNNRLRLAITHLYSAVSVVDVSSSVVGPELSQEMQLEASSQMFSSLKQVDDLNDEKIEPSACRPDKNFAQISNLGLNKTGVWLPSSSPTNDFHIDGVSRPETAPVGLLRGKHVSKSFSITGNSGKSLGPMQQPNGSVPVL